MSGPSTSLCRVAIDEVWLEFMIDGEGDYFIHARGRVIDAISEHLKPIRTLEFQLGHCDALGAGLHILGSRGSARILKDQAQVEALRALLEKATEPGAYLVADITTVGPGTVRANGRAHSWAACDAGFDLVHGAPPDTPDRTAFDPEDAANIRAELELTLVPSGISASEPITLSGEVMTLSGVDLADFDRLTLHLDPTAREGRLRVKDLAAELTWPTPAADLPHIHAMLRTANRFGRLLADVDLGARALDEARTLWPVTDVSLMARVLKA